MTLDIWQTTERQHPARELEWGRHYLMCPPNYFDVSYSINPWMDPSVKIDYGLAREQWAGLARILRELGATVEEMAPEPGLPDMVFTANAGIAVPQVWWPARMRHAERRGEVSHVSAWLQRRGWEVAPALTAVVQEGSGDALPFAGRLVAGYGERSERQAYANLIRTTGWDILPLELADHRYYHIDLAFCPVDECSAIIVPEAFTSTGLRALAALVPDPIFTTGQEGLGFCANSVVVGRTIVMPACTPRLRRLLENRGFEVLCHDVSEFVKAGGGCRCMTLALDFVLPTRRSELVP